MTPREQVTVMFITNSVYRRGDGGGVQWCTREYLQTLEAAGLGVRIIEYQVDSSWRARVRRLVRPAPFRYLLPAELAERVARESQPNETIWILLNNTEALALAPRLRRRDRNARIAFLSHGAEITDAVNNLRLAPSQLRRAERRPSWIGRMIHAEIKFRESIDGSVCISEGDLEVERWLGAPKTLFIPRQIQVSKLDLQPIIGRVGCVATLDHGPNFDGLLLMADALERSEGVTLRLVGGPNDVGSRLAKQFSCIEYLGRLSEAELQAEASTWCAFVNPIFCQARGASTKVATALGWGLPVLTTRQGARGYRWDEEALPLAETPEELALFARKVSHSDAATWRDGAEKVSRLAPSPTEAGEMLRGFLGIA